MSIWQKLENAPFMKIARLTQQYKMYITVPKVVYFKALRELKKLDYLRDIKSKTVTLYFKSEREMNKAIKILLKYFSRKVKIKVRN